MEYSQRQLLGQIKYLIEGICNLASRDNTLSGCVKLDKIEAKAYHIGRIITILSEREEK